MGLCTYICWSHAPDPSIDESTYTVMSSVQGCGTRVFDYCTEIPLVDVARRAQPIWMDPLPLPLPDDPLILPSERPPNSRPCSGRVSGLRGQLLSRRESEPLSLLHSSSSHLPTCLDDHTPRLKTAVSTVETAKISDYFLTPHVSSSSSSRCCPRAVFPFPCSPLAQTHASSFPLWTAVGMEKERGLR